METSDTGRVSAHVRRFDDEVLKPAGDMLRAADMPVIARFSLALAAAMMGLFVWVGGLIIVGTPVLLGLGFALYSLFHVGHSGYDLFNQISDLLQKHATGWELWSAVGAILAGLTMWVYKSAHTRHKLEHAWNMFRYSVGWTTEHPEKELLRHLAEKHGYDLKEKHPA